MPAYELFDLVNEFDKTYYKDIHERGSIESFIQWTYC